ncbi:V-type ATP synthase subunit F [Candidatus Peregrinibacteria bacterium]|nr:V-type ATP synthase subunit F [Candidatus Peregrinibacteria bacterium]
MNQYKMAIIGPRETILGFKALGLEPVYATDPKEAVERLYSLKRERTEVDGESINKYAIVFIMEDLARGVTPDDYKKLSAEPLPAIIPLPSHLGTTGYGLQKLKTIVEKAVGMDILS